ncbi:Holliday junction resolvase RuvX [Demequina globuliformis]|uniref:Holliday junction resolvase RuvX n=1 Tax=Demequina globuliformis TaxID=676202 RepID=UPI00078294EE|nr:Holliday junction resolvase RuvX [Demequina globuliformis]
MPRERGVRLGVDVGKVRIGIAASDPEGRLAFPVTTVKRGPRSVEEILDIISEREARQVFVGLPRKLSGELGPSAEDAMDIGQQIAERTDAVVRLVDERFSTASASASMRQAGRNAKQQREVIDQAAAVVILETALETEQRGNLGKVSQVMARKGDND